VNDPFAAVVADRTPIVTTAPASGAPVAFVTVPETGNVGGPPTGPNA